MKCQKPALGKIRKYFKMLSVEFFLRRVLSVNKFYLHLEAET